MENGALEMISKISLITGILAALGLPSITAMVVWLCSQWNNARKEAKDKEKHQNAALQILLRSDLNRMYKEAQSRGRKITDDDLKLWMDEYEIYHSLGTNGIMDSKKEQILKFDIVDKY